MKPTVVIYREQLFAPSEPFIPAQAQALQRHAPAYLSIRRMGSAPAGSRDLRWRSVPLGQRVRRAVWKQWGLAPGTGRTVARLRPRLVHAHFGRDAVQVLPLVERLGVPLVVTFHGHDAFRSDDDLRRGSNSDRLYLRRRARLAEVGARFVAVSDAVHDRLLGLGFPADRVVTHHIGVDVDEIDRNVVGRPDESVVLFVGRLVPHKGADDVLTAVARLRAHRPDLRLVVLGDGPERGVLERRALDLGVPAAFEGFVPAQEVWRWMGAAGVVAVASRPDPSGWVEAFGLTAAEAQAAGAPVVVSTCGGLREAVAPSNRERVFEPGDAGALADRLEVALDEGRGERTASARAWVRDHLDLAVQSRRLEDIYDEAAV